MKKVIYYVGLNDKDQKKQIIETEQARKIIADVVGDNTMQLVMGTFTHEDNTKVNENTFKVECFVDNTDNLKANCEDIKRLLNQESIYIEVSEVNGLFI